MKYETHNEYSPQTVAFSEAALLTLCSILEPWQDDLVLVGGLVPRYICGDVASPRDLPRPVTMDADFGIALGASAGGMLRVCEAGPFLAMKLRAFAWRQAPKDAFDILYTLRHYDRGTNHAVTAFGEEVRAGNPACADAVACLNQYFHDEQSSAPVRSASFVLGQGVPGESEDIRFRRLQIQQDMVDAGHLLQKALTV